MTFKKKYPQIKTYEPDENGFIVYDEPKFSEEFYKKFKKLTKSKKPGRIFTPLYKEARVYKPRPFYNSFNELPIELKKVFELALQVFEEKQVDWITLKKFLNDKTNPKFRALWGFSLRHRGTEKIIIRQNDINILEEWERRTNYVPLIDETKIYNEEEGYANFLKGLINKSQAYKKNNVIDLINEEYLKEIEKLKK